MEQNTNTTIFSTGAIEFSRFVFSLYSGKGRELLRYAALAAYEALGDGNQFARLQDYSGITGSVNNEILHFPEHSTWLEELQMLALNPEQKVISWVRSGNRHYRTPLLLTPDGHIYLQRNYEAERSIAAKWVTLCMPDAGRLQYDRDLAARLFESNGRRNEDQCSAITGALENRFTFITGGPGTGKTTVLTKILLLELQRNPDLRFVLCAPTGKGQARITESIREGLLSLRKQVEDFKIPMERLEKPECSTVHSLLAHNRNTVMPYDLLVMDEGSMASLPLMAQFFDKLAKDTRVLICGDRNQLPSVEEGAVVNDLYRAGTEGLFPGLVRELRENFRSAGAPNIVGFSSRMPELGNGHDEALALANEMLKCQADDFRGIPWNDGRAFAGMEALTEQLARGDKKLFGAEGSPFARIVRLAQKEDTDEARDEAFKLLDNFKILCAVREGVFGVNAINAAMAKALKLGTGAAPGLPLMIVNNDWKHTGLCNGDCGIIWKSSNGSLLAYFPDGENGYRKFAVPELPPWEPVFAMTIHKSQGSGYRDVLILVPGNPSPVLTRELIYTAITRARKKVLLAGAPSILAEGLRNKTKRNSAILKWLKEVRGNMIYVVARANVKPECLDQYLAAVNEIVPVVLAEDGCIRYEACVDWTEDGSKTPAVIMLETWADKQHLDAHLASAHMKEFLAKVAPLREGASSLQILKPALP